MYKFTLAYFLVTSWALLTCAYAQGVSYEDIQWQWFQADSEFAKQRLAAKAKLESLRGEFVPTKVFANGKYLYTEKRVFHTLQFRWDAIEGGGLLGVQPTHVPQGVTNEILRETLPYFPELKCILLPMTSVTDEGLPVLSTLKHLEDIRLLSGAPDEFPVLITPKGLEYISQKCNLKRIALVGLNYTDKDVECLRHLSNLESVTFQHCKVTPNCFHTLAALPKLKRIAITNTDLSSPLPKELGDLITTSLNGRLESIDLFSTQASSGLIAALVKIKSLEEINFMGSVFEPGLWNELEGMKRLRDLTTNSWPANNRKDSSLPWDPEWVRFCAQKVKPSGFINSYTPRFWGTRLGADYQEVKAWLEELEQNKKAELLKLR